MSVYIGPCNYRRDETEISERSQGNPSENDGDLDMKNYRIVNLTQSGESRSDAATVGIVSDWVGHLTITKLTGVVVQWLVILIMGGFKIREVSDPEDDKDVINKRYFMNTLLQTKPYDLGRYIVFPHADGSETFSGAGSKRHIDLENGKVFEIFDSDLYNPQNIIYTPFRTLGSHVENLQLYAPFSIPPNLPNPWTFVFSIRPEDPPIEGNNLELRFENTKKT